MLHYYHITFLIPKSYTIFKTDNQPLTSSLFSLEEFFFVVRIIRLYLVSTRSAGCDATDDANIAILILLYLELRANFRTVH